MSAAQRTLLSSACRRSSRLLLLLALTASLPGYVGAGQAATPDAAQTDKPSNLRPGTANWFTHPWSALLGKSPPPPPAQPKGPIPTYPQVRYPVLDSAFPIADKEHLWWLDNDRVVFMGYEPGSYDPGWEKKTLSQRRADGRETDMRVGHYVWDTRTNEVRLFRRRLHDFCVEEGVSAFLELPDKEAPPPAKITPLWIGPLTLWTGPFGKERPKPDIDANRLVDNRWTPGPCGVIAPPGGFGARIPLHAGWGVLERRRFDQPLLYTPRKGPPRELPLLTKDWGRSALRPLAQAVPAQRNSRQQRNNAGDLVVVAGRQHAGDCHPEYRLPQRFLSSDPPRRADDRPVAAWRKGDSNAGELHSRQRRQRTEYRPLLALQVRYLTERLPHRLPEFPLLPRPLTFG